MLIEVKNESYKFVLITFRDEEVHSNALGIQAWILFRGTFKNK